MFEGSFECFLCAVGFIAGVALGWYLRKPVAPPSDPPKKNTRSSKTGLTMWD